MIDFIVKYWVEVLFGLICGGIAFTVRHHIKLIIEEKKRQNENLLNKIDDKFKVQSEHMKEQMSECYTNLIQVVQESEARSQAEDAVIHHEIDVIKDGMLSIEGRSFRNECRRLLEEDHIITFDEYTTILAEHTTYNNLGGNHDGDRLFSLVEQRYQQQQNRRLNNNIEGE